MENGTKGKGFHLGTPGVSHYLFVSASLFFYEKAQNIKGNGASHYINGVSLCLSPARNCEQLASIRVIIQLLFPIKPLGW